eukprot:626411-Rhodomonas_salina.1
MHARVQAAAPLTPDQQKQVPRLHTALPPPPHTNIPYHHMLSQYRASHSSIPCSSTARIRAPYPL